MSLPFCRDGTTFEAVVARVVRRDLDHFEAHAAPADSARGRWRADYGGPPKFTMYVPNETLRSELRNVLGG